MSEQKKSITVSIADRPYKLTVLGTQEEERVRKALSLLQSKMDEMASSYGGAKDKFDHLAMASLLLCVEMIEKDETSKMVAHNLEGKLDQLHQIINKLDSPT